MKKIKQIIALLRKAYGRPPAPRKSEPVDELVRTVLSQNTSDNNSLKAFAVLKSRFKRWDELLNTPAGRIARLIRHAGLANIKAHRIKGILKEIKEREGRITLRSLSALDDADALGYLKSLKGVGPKTAACVLLFSFGRPVMPVDTHIFRVTKRLGLIGKDIDIKEAHEILLDMLQKGLVPRRGLRSNQRPCSGSRPDSLLAALIYNFHLGIIEHGRRTCKAQNPKCRICVLYSLCRFEKKEFFRKRGRI